MPYRLAALPNEHNRGFSATPSELSAAPPNIDYVKSAGYLLLRHWLVQKATPAGKEELFLEPVDSNGMSAYGTPLPLHALALFQIQWEFY